MTSGSTLQEQLLATGIVATGTGTKAKKREELLKMELLDQDIVRIELIKPKGFNNKFFPGRTNELYLEFRRLIRVLTEDMSWNIRYASQIKNEAFPVLISSSRFKIAIDVLAPYRDPIRALAKDQTLHLSILDCLPHYFHRIEDVSGFRKNLYEPARVPDRLVEGDKKTKGS